MKLSVLFPMLVAGILVSGCIFHRHKASKPAPATSSAPKAASVIITPDNSLTGKVVSYNDAGRFVVLNFPIGRMPEVGQTIFIYRGGLKTGELKITGPKDDNNNIVADLVTGDARAGDEVRDQ